MVCILELKHEIKSVTTLAELWRKDNYIAVYNSIGIAQKNLSLIHKHVNLFMGKSGLPFSTYEGKHTKAATHCARVCMPASVLATSCLIWCSSRLRRPTLFLAIITSVLSKSASQRLAPLPPELTAGWRRHMTWLENITRTVMIYT